MSIGTFEPFGDLGMRIVPTLPIFHGYMISSPGGCGNEEASMHEHDYSDEHEDGHRYEQPHGHSHVHGEHHGHTHGIVDPTITTTDEGIWAIKWSFIGLFLTACIQLAVVTVSSSVELLADTIHNFGDAVTAVPLWAAFALAKRRPSKRFTFGYGRVEDLAGILIVLIILFSAIVAAYESIDR